MGLDVSRLGAWRNLPFFQNDSGGVARIETALAAERRAVLPPKEMIFAALERTQPAAVRVVILGQDPYPTPGHAHGFAFSADAHTRPLPRSLANIFKEMESDIGAAPAGADLRFWADQGVLLLNTALTVPAGAAGGHSKIGWRSLVTDILDHLQPTPRAFVLWGRAAQTLGASVTGPAHLKLETAHPSPLSAARGFFGSRPFSSVNRWLESRAEPPINWVQEAT